MMGCLGRASSSVVEWFVLSLKTSFGALPSKKNLELEKCPQTFLDSVVRSLSRQARGRITKLRTPHTSMSRRFCEAVDCEVRRESFDSLLRKA
ncbi:hypothetical protein B0H14DRAFT_2933085, partial [Mycena olivaceomarginata]